jgi:hypothetical protein
MTDQAIPARLVAKGVGQEFSTRAVRRLDWPLCREAYIEIEVEVEDDDN